MSGPPATERRVKKTTPAEQQLAELRAFHTRVVHCASTDVREWRALAGPRLRELSDEQLRYEVAWAWLRAWATSEAGEAEGDDGEARRARLMQVLPAQQAWLDHLAALPAGDELRDYRDERTSTTRTWRALLAETH